VEKFTMDLASVVAIVGGSLLGAKYATSTVTGLHNLDPHYKALLNNIQHLLALIGSLGCSLSFIAYWLKANKFRAYLPSQVNATKMQMDARNKCIDEIKNNPVAASKKTKT
jgi:hypothetical protein